MSKYENLTYKQEFAADKMSKQDFEAMETMCVEYRRFLDLGKTERECVAYSIQLAESAGFVSIDTKDKLVKGDKIYIVNRKKNIMLVIVGEDITDGINLVGAHIDSPRLDLKQNPLYESCNNALLKTHYYGGIKKYQWTAIPLAMHGVIFTKEGKEVNICIGENDDDPVFCITDLLPHLGRDQMSKKMSEGVEGEALNILVGGFKIDDEDEKNRFSLNVLNILNKKYGITQRDFLSAEIEIVPAFKAKNIGFDGAFIGAYGQDDRVCGFTSLKSIFDVKNPKRTSACILVDKEEIGSCGNTGMLSDFFRMTVAQMIEMQKGSCTLTMLNRTISKSACLSSDVSNAVDPNYESVSEKLNSTYAGNGVGIIKYNGAGGKSSSSDANAEFIYKVYKILDDENVVWQTGELGKVDQGGGGTIAKYLANLNMDVVDCGVPVLSMHAPFEVVAKTDVYMAYRAYIAFFENLI